MTDATDTKALSTLSMQRVKEIANGDSMLMGERVDLANTAIRFHKELDVALDAFKNAATELFSAQEQLEAERQRSAGSEEELHKSLHREKAAERKLLAAQAELAALKGEQVPVAYTAARWLDTRCKVSVWTDRESAALGVGDNSRLIELFTAPQKPVVLSFDAWCESKGDKPIGWVREAMKEAYDAAIEAAGGIVKDNSTDHIGDKNV